MDAISIVNGKRVKENQEKSDKLIYLVKSLTRNGIRQREIAQVLNVSQGTISQICLGDMDYMTLSTLSRVCALAQPYIIAPSISSEDREVMEKFGVIVFSRKPSSDELFDIGLERLQKIFS